MIDQEIKEQLDRIEQYAMIAAKNMLNINRYFAISPIRTLSRHSYNCSSLQSKSIELS